MVDPELKKANALASVAFLTNLSGLAKPIYQETLIPAYQRLKRYCGLKRPDTYVGSCDSFIENMGDRIVLAFERFARRYGDGLQITLNERSAPTGARFTNERHLGGALSCGELPCEPIFTGAAILQRSILDQFDSLLASDPAESRLQEFLTENYQSLFGAKFDRIETQLWLRFPDLDQGARSRRLDMFLRNSVTNDWHLFEIKRPTALTRTVRDVPVISAHVMKAIHQIKNYARLLSQDRVKRHFANLGIEYFEPSLTVGIGRSPESPLQQWRWLKSVSEGSVSILTFDELRIELTSRLNERFVLIESLVGPHRRTSVPRSAGRSQNARSRDSTTCRARKPGSHEDCAGIAGARRTRRHRSFAHRGEKGRSAILLEDA